MSGSSEILAAIRDLQTHLEGQFHATNKAIQELHKSTDLWFDALQAGPLLARSGSYGSFQRPPSPAEALAPASSPAFRSDGSSFRSGGSSFVPQQRRLLTAPFQSPGSAAPPPFLSFDVTSAAPPPDPAPEPTAILTALLEKAGCETSDSLSTFAPIDEASKDVDSPDLCKLSKAEVVPFLQYQALAAYTPVGSLKQTEGRITTLATNGAGKYNLGVKTVGDSITLDTGVDSSRIASPVLESTPLSSKTPSPAPGLALEVTPTPNFHFQPLPPPPPLLFSLTKVLSRSTQVDQQLEIKFWPNPLDTEAQAMVIFLGTKDMLGHWWKYVLLGTFRRGVIFSLFALEEVYKDILESPP